MFELYETCINQNLISTLIILVFTFTLIKWYCTGTKCNSKISLTGKVAIVTGANTGIGFATALDFARRDARVILACRDLKKAEKAAEKLVSFSNNKKIQVEQLNLADLRSVRDFSDKMKSSLNRLDLLINNAGIMAPPYGKTKDGFELQFGTNHLGPFLLTNLLLDLLKKTEGSRIVNVSSLTHKYCTMEWDDLNSEKNYVPMKAYAQSKLANILFTRELSRRLANTSVTAYSVHPGVVRTEITRPNMNGWLKYLYFLQKLFFLVWYMFSKSAKEGAQTIIFCAIMYEALQYSGCYFSDCKVKTPSLEARREGSPEKLWTISEKMVNL